MDDVYGRIEVFPQYFMPSKEAMESPDGLSTIHVDVPGLLNELRELHLFCVCCPFPTLDGRQAMKMMTRLNCPELKWSHYELK